MENGSERLAKSRGVISMVFAEPKTGNEIQAGGGQNWAK